MFNIVCGYFGHLGGTTDIWRQSNHTKDPVAIFQPRLGPTYVIFGPTGDEVFLSTRENWTELVLVRGATCAIFNLQGGDSCDDYADLDLRLIF